MPCSDHNICLSLAEVVQGPHTTGDPSITALLLEWHLVSIPGEMLCMGGQQTCQKVNNALRAIVCIDYNVSTDTNLGMLAFKYLWFQMDSCPSWQGGCSSTRICWSSDCYQSFALSFNPENTGPHKDIITMELAFHQFAGMNLKTLFDFFHYRPGLFLISQEKNTRTRKSCMSWGGSVTWDLIWKSVTEGGVSNSLR